MVVLGVVKVQAQCQNCKVMSVDDHNSEEACKCTDNKKEDGGFLARIMGTLKDLLFTQDVQEQQKMSKGELQKAEQLVQSLTFDKFHETVLLVEKYGIATKNYKRLATRMADRYEFPKELRGELEDADLQKFTRVCRRCIHSDKLHCQSHLRLCDVSKLSRGGAMYRSHNFVISFLRKTQMATWCWYES